jgi:hypothetical protein
VVSIQDIRFLEEKMNKRKIYFGALLAATVMFSLFALGFPTRISPARSAQPLADNTILLASDVEAPAAANSLVLMYSAKFVCTEALPAGTFMFGTTTPIVSQKTDVLIHNPNDFQVTLYRKAVKATFVDSAPVAPGAWNSYQLGADYSIKLTCDDVAKLLTGNPSATFIGTYGIGVTVEGFVVIGVGAQSTSGQTRYANLDVTAEYVRSSEVLKKDVNLQPWWQYWWWPLPWKLGYPYQRILTIDPTYNIDCRANLTSQLREDVNNMMPNLSMRYATLDALNAGESYDPRTLHTLSEPTTYALVPLIGRCDKISSTQMSVDYVLFSNKGPTDPDPITGVPPIVVSYNYPWLPGHWYDIPVVMPQNVAADIDSYYRTWFKQRWIDLGASSSSVSEAMVYFAPYWSNWGHWWWWWNGGDSVDIGVGDGESLDVEQIMPTRVIMTQWPP